MNQLSFKNKQLKLEISGELLFVLEESVEYIPKMNESKTGR